MSDNDLIKNTLTPPIERPWGRLIPCSSSVKTIEICQETFKIGRGVTCDVVINNDMLPAHQIQRVISSEHCLITKENDTCYITDISRNGTFINGVNLMGKQVVLNNDDKIALGKENWNVFVFKQHEDEEILTLTASDTSDFTLTPRAVLPTWGRLLSCSVHLRSFDLYNLTFKVGRCASCDAVIDQMAANPRLKRAFSKVHFILVKDPDSTMTYISDLSSTGTYLNGRLIGRHRKNILQNEDVISIGQKKTAVYVYRSMLSPNSVFPVELRGRYEPCMLLGKGGCGEVKLAYEKYTCRKFAIKNIVKGRSSLSQTDKLNHPDKIQTEINILQSLSHPFIIQMEEIVETDDEVFIVLEYMRGGELSNRIPSLTENNAKFFFYQMVLAVDYLHGNGITHRDLKPENVLLSSDDVETVIKLTDFGLSKITEDGLMRTVCGTLCYIPPEMLNPLIREYDKQVDVWSLGVILFFMLSKNLPFRSANKNTSRELIKSGYFTMDDGEWNGVSQIAKNLVRRMLTVDPQERITVEGILRHPWISQDLSMQYRVKIMMDEWHALQNNNEPPNKRVKQSSDDESTD